MCAGLDKDALSPLSSDMIEWADHILVMEKNHRNRLSKKFKPFLKNKRIGVLGIPDDYDFMDPVLVQRLKAIVPRYIRL